MLILLLSTLGLGASETELPPALRADVSVGYELGADWTGLEEDGEDGPVEVGRRQDIRHDLAFRASFSFVEGVAVTAGADIVASRTLRHKTGQPMLQDPVTGRGSFLGGPQLTDLPSYRGGGVEGFWIGMAFQPFAERFEKEHQVTWRLDVAVRTPPARTFWEEGESGRRGAGQGGPTYRLAGAFSRDHGVSSPYMTVDWRITTPRSVAVPDSDGGTADLQVAPGHRLDAIGGIELRMTKEGASNRVDFDLLTGLGYRSPQSIPSGIFLADVLASSRKEAVIRAERLGWHAGAAFDIEVDDPVEIRLWSRMYWALPWRVEDRYKVRTTLDSVQTRFGIDVRVKIR